jgi:nicotinic acid phosphoribosyltransferase
MYPAGTEFVYSNFTPRSDKHFKAGPLTAQGAIVFGITGLFAEMHKAFNEMFFDQYLHEVLNDYRTSVAPFMGLALEDVDTSHIEALHGLGYLPIDIRALNEGTLCPFNVPCLTITNTDPRFFWLTNYLETWISAEGWKPMTSATIAYHMKKILTDWAIKTGGDVSFVDWQGHDFSMRGMSGTHDAARTGAGHLTSFLGSDTIPAADYLRQYYRGNEVPLIAGSVPASEHSVMTMGGKEGEFEIFDRILFDVHPTGVVSAVSDSFDFWAVMTEYAPSRKERILARGVNSLGMGKVVFRPDCYDEQTEIITKSGWKYFKDLQESDLVGQVTQEGGLEFVKPIRIINQEYFGDMIEFRDHFGKVDLLVTPNHRMVFKFPKSPGLKVQEASKATFYNKKTAIRSASLPGLGQELTALDRLRVAFQADGSYPSNQPENEGGISGFKTIRFNFAKERKIQRLEQIILEGGWKYTKTQYPSRDGQWAFYIWLPLDVEMNKDFDWIDVNSIECGDWCRDFVEEVSHWDACRRHDERFKFDTTVPEVAVVVRDIAIRAGYGALLSTYSDERQEHFSDVYTVHIMLNNEIDTQAFTKRTVQYSGRVYCVQVPTGMVLVKRNKCTMVSGNSGDPVKILTGLTVEEVRSLDSLSPMDFIGEEAEALKFQGKYYWFGHEGKLQELSEAEVKGAVECLWDVFGGTVTDKGFKVLHERVGLIYGDSITMDRANEICRRLAAKGFASTNCVFGIGSYTYQYVSRDTLGFAMKATYGVVNGEPREIFKAPKTDPGKNSAKGLLRVDRNEQGVITLYDQQSPGEAAGGLLKPVYKDGIFNQEWLDQNTLAMIRDRVAGRIE